MKLLFIVSTMLALSACGGNASIAEDNAAKKPVSISPSAGTAAGLDALPPGQYSVSNQVTNMDIPGRSPEQAAAIKQELGRPVVQETCLTADVLKPEGDYNTMEGVISAAMGDTENGGCTFSEFSTTGGKIAGKMSCENSNYGKITSATVKGSITANKTRFTVDGTMRVQDVSEEPVGFTNTTTMTRKGSCSG